MKLQLSLPPIAYPFRIHYSDKILFVGSCFTENISEQLKKMRFHVLANPSGILFDPKSIVQHLINYVSGGRPTDEHFFFHQDLWHSWQHHSKFSHPEKRSVATHIDSATQQAHDFLLQADFLFVTLGSAFSYYLSAKDFFVANCHQYPQQAFQKKLIKSNEIIADFTSVIASLLKIKPSLKIIFNISPVRHIRDGVIENNRSKANLLEAVHSLVEIFPEHVFYFPSYELMIDVLRDYRYYDKDLVHPNYIGTELVLEHFQSSLFGAETQSFIAEILPIIHSLNHRPQHTETSIHQQFLVLLQEKIMAFEKKYNGIKILP